MEYREVIIALLLLLGFATAVFFLMANKNPAAGNSPLTTESPNATQQPADTSQPANATPPQNKTPEEQQTQIKVTDETIGQLLDAGVARADSAFYSQTSAGSYDMSSFRWTMGQFNQTPTEIALTKNDLNTAGIRFPDRYDGGLRGIVFKLYEPAESSAPPAIFGTVVFISEPTILDGYLSNKSKFSIHYDPHPEGSQVIDGCSIRSVLKLQDPAGNPINIYDLSCQVMYGE